MSKNNTKPKPKIPEPVTAEPLYKMVPTLSDRVDSEIQAEYGNLGENIPALLNAILRELVTKRLGG